MNKIIFAIPFTGKTPNSDTQTQEWFDFRAEIFKDFTLKSLENQTDKDFLLWLQFKATDEDNSTVEKIKEALDKSGLQYKMTFQSPIMMEDKATWHNEDLIERAEKSLKQLEPIKEDYVIEVGLDSDDMVHKTFVEILKGKEWSERKAFYMHKGYAYSIDGRMSKWNNRFSMSIYAIMYPTEIFLDAKKHFEYQEGFNSHEQIPIKFLAELLPDGLYCSVIHGTNISTVWGHPYQGEEIFYSDEIEDILKQFKKI
jgi:Putative rhamnosyl transferase